MDLLCGMNKDKTMTRIYVVWNFVPYTSTFLTLLMWIFSTEDLDLQKYFEILSIKILPGGSRKISQNNMLAIGSENPLMVHAGTCVWDWWSWVWQSVADMLCALGYNAHELEYPSCIFSHPSHFISFLKICCLSL